MYPEAKIIRDSYAKLKSLLPINRIIFLPAKIKINIMAKLTGNNNFITRSLKLIFLPKSIGFGSTD